MGDYRIYLLNERGRIQSGHDVSCDSDAEACAHAEGMLSRHSHAEVWLGIRQVGVISSQRKEVI